MSLHVGIALGLCGADPLVRVRDLTVEAFRNPRKSATVRAYLVLLTTLATLQRLDHVPSRHRGANTRRIELEGLKGILFTRVYPCSSVAPNMPSLAQQLRSKTTWATDERRSTRIKLRVLRAAGLIRVAKIATLASRTPLVRVLVRSRPPGRPAGEWRRLIPLGKSGTWASRADQGVRPTKHA